MAAGIVSNDLNRSYAGDAAATGGAGNSGLDQVGFFLHTGYCECDDPPQPPVMNLLLYPLISLFCRLFCCLVSLS